MKKFHPQLLGIPSALCIAACGSDPADTTLQQDWSAYVTSLVERVVLPDAEQFEQDAATLLTSVQTLCGGPTVTSLAQAQSDFRSLHTSWGGVVPHFLGPLDNDPIIPRMYFIESMRQRGTYDIDRVRQTANLFTEQAELPTEQNVQKTTFNRLGLLAVEVLLFEAKDEVIEAQAVVDGLTNSPARCRWLELLVGQVAKEADSIATGWKDFRAVPGAAQQATVTFMIRWGDHLDYTIKRKLEAILDAQLSDNFFNHQAFMLARMQEVLRPGVPLVVSPERFDSVLQAQALFEQSIERASRRDRQALSESMQSLRFQFRHDLPEAAALPLGLNFNDGD